MYRGTRKARIHLEVNGVMSDFEVPVWHTLAELLRDKMNLTGTKLGCNRAECGACSVLLNGKLVFACTILAASADGKKVETIEGISRDARWLPLQEALLKHDGLQCGFCTPGIMVALKALFEENPTPTLADVRNGIAGNYCRCGAYLNIFEAALGAAEGVRRPVD